LDDRAIASYRVIAGTKGKETGMLKWVIAAGLLVALPTVASAQDADAGAKVFKLKCSPCHMIGPGAKTRVGPELNGILGRKAGSVAGFKYSEGLKNSGITWDDAHLHQWLSGPKKLVPGTKMILPGGIKDELDRDDLIAYLESFNADGTQKK
jgi:cytochrome c